jgi:hypothetical protein
VNEGAVPKHWEAESLERVRAYGGRYELEGPVELMSHSIDLALGDQKKQIGKGNTEEKIDKRKS